MQIKTGYPNVIVFVLTWRVIDEFEKYITLFCGETFQQYINSKQNMCR